MLGKMNFGFVNWIINVLYISVVTYSTYTTCVSIQNYLINMSDFVYIIKSNNEYNHDVLMWKNYIVDIHSEIEIINYITAKNNTCNDLLHHAWIHYPKQSNYKSDYDFIVPTKWGKIYKTINI